MAISRQEVLKVGTLSRISLSGVEVDRFASQLSDILGYVDKLAELDTEGVEPLAHALDQSNVLREDEPRPGSCEIADGSGVSGRARRLPQRLVLACAVQSPRAPLDHAHDRPSARAR